MAKSFAGRTAYSYIRFSKDSQAKGGSLQRQLDASNAWIEKNGCILDDSLNLRDFGISAFKGKNLTEGKLGVFIKAAEQGRIPKGSILVVENLDRLSRHQIRKALQLFLTILNLGITIVTLTPEEVFHDEIDDESPSNDLVQIIVAIVIMSRAYEESDTKAKRVRIEREKGRKAAREEKRPISKRCPAWLVVNDKREYVVNKAAARTINQIFQYSLEGLGSKAITKKLIQDKRAWISKSPIKRPRDPKTHEPIGEPGWVELPWGESYVEKLLKDARVIGHYQPYTTAPGERTNRQKAGDVIVDFYPVIVDPKVFYAVKKLRAAFPGTAGKRGLVFALFTGLLKCAYCGAPMDSDRKKPAAYLCRDARLKKAPKGCRCVATARTPRFSIKECETAILNNCPQIKPELVLPAPEEQASKVAELKLSIASNQGKMAENTESIENLGKLLRKAKTDKQRQMWVDDQAALMAENETLDAAIAADRIELTKTEKNSKSFADWTRDLAELTKAIDHKDLDVQSEHRERLRQHLKSFIAKIEVFGVGHRKMHDPKEVAAAVKQLAKTKPELFKGTMAKIHLMRDPLHIAASDGDTYADYLDAVMDEAGIVGKEASRFSAWVMEQRQSKRGRFLRVHFTTGVVLDIVPGDSIASGYRWAKGRQFADEQHDPDADKLAFRNVEPSFTELWDEFEALTEPKSRKRRKAAKV